MIQKPIFEVVFHCENCEKENTVTAKAKVFRMAERNYELSKELEPHEIDKLESIGLRCECGKLTECKPILCVGMLHRKQLKDLE